MNKTDTFGTVLWAVSAILWAILGGIHLWKGESPNIPIIAMMCSCILMKLCDMEVKK